VTDSVGRIYACYDPPLGTYHTLAKMTTLDNFKALLRSRKKAAATGQTSLDAQQRRERHLHLSNRLENFIWLLNHPPVALAPKLSKHPGVDAPDDRALVIRVMKAYRSAMRQFSSSGGGWDDWHFNLKKPIHDALVGDDVEAASKILRDPASSTFFFGFDAVASSPAGEPEPHQLVIARLNQSAKWQDLYAIWLCDALVSLAEAVGARRVSYPEIDMDANLTSEAPSIDIDGILNDIDEALGIQLAFPNPFPDELGLPSKRGVIGFRALQAVYQGWRIAQLANKNKDFRVLEIGAGLGRTADFASQLGIKHYSIVDIPLTSAAQGYFLGRVHGAENVALGGENSPAKFKILPSVEFSQHNEKYDLVVNIDSWTEMPRSVSEMYWAFCRQATRTVLSINHEYNPHTVRDLYSKYTDVQATRHPYPMRRGYVEEIICW